MTLTEEFIQGLENMKEADRSLLRKLARQPLDETVPGFDLFTGLWWPLRRRSPWAPERRTAWLVAKLYAAHPVPNVRGPAAHLASVLGKCKRAHNPPDSKRLDARFDALLQQPLSALEPHLAWALATVRNAVAQKHLDGIDWIQLLDDLRYWARGSDGPYSELEGQRRDIREVWAEKYLARAH